MDNNNFQGNQDMNAGQPVTPQQEPPMYHQQEQPVYQQPVQGGQYQQYHQPNQANTYNPSFNPPPVYPPLNNLEEPVSVGDWVLSMFIAWLPCIGIIMIFIWAFGDTKKSKSNYFKATLIWTLIGIVIWVIVFVLMTTVFAGSMYSLTDYMNY